MKEVRYPVYERYFTFQGEGEHMGEPAFFVRLFGCPIGCDFCDSAGTWHPKWIPQRVEKMSPSEIVEEAQVYGDRTLVVITGGEPTIHDLHHLTLLIRANGLLSSLETCGAFPIKGHFDWITLSPKRLKWPLPENVRMAHEFKIIVEHPKDIEFFISHLLDLGLKDREDQPSIWLHPEWSQRENKDVLKAITETVKQGSLRGIRAGWQIHKLYLADQQDSRMKTPIPLGGNEAKGY